MRTALMPALDRSSHSGKPRSRTSDGRSPPWVVDIAVLVLSAMVCTGAAGAETTPGAPSEVQTRQVAPSAGGAPTADVAAEEPVRDKLLFPEKLSTEVRRQTDRIDQLAKSVERVRDHDEQLDALRPGIVALATEAERAERELRPHIETIERLIAGLGDKPKEGAPPETPAVAAQREKLEGTRTQLLGAQQQVRLGQVRAKQLLARVQSLRLENLGRDLRKRYASPLTLAYWQQLSEDLPRFANQVTTVAGNWWSLAAGKTSWLLSILVGAAALLWALKRAARVKVRQWLRLPIEAGRPAYLKRVSMATCTLPVMLAPGLITIGFIYVALWSAGLFNDQVDALALAALKALALFIATNALAKTILLPWKPAWRLIGLPTPDARRYLWLSRLLAGVYALDLWLNETFAALQVPVSIGAGASLATNVSFAVLLLAFAWLPVNFGDSTESSATGAAAAATPAAEPATPARKRVSARLMRHAIRWLRVPATLAVVVILAATLLGYFALGRFAAGQVMLIGLGATAVLLGHLVTRALAAHTPAPSPALDAAQQSRLSFTAKWRHQVYAVLAFLLNVVLALAAIAGLLLSWGMSSAELVGWASSLLFGFEIGKFKFSLLQILIALTLFVGTIMATRFLQAWLSGKVLTPERMDRGIANSIHSGIGYAGIALAALVGVSYAGLDLSNIALIASALSIGIGFGLNAIASNFVSGLIMLIERPIKVGDWVVVGQHQGYVRHISVRATEIETFDRASVIIPNSDFMTSAVQNWTHRNAMGRVIVNIGASYKADPDKVMAVLQKVAADCDQLLKYPAPLITFEEFGASSLDFAVRGYIGDVTKMLVAKTALRLAIAKAFTEAGIEIPYPQQDVHLRDLDGVRELVGQAMAARAAETAPKDAASVNSPAHANSTPSRDNTNVKA